MVDSIIKSKFSSQVTFKQFLYFFLPVYVGFYVNNLVRHELWRDEIQPWGLAASSSSLGDLFSKMEYEGRPPLWQIILFACSRISTDPNTLKFLALAIFLANTVLVLKLTRFSPVIRIMILLGFYFLFGYSVTSRDYNLMLLIHLIVIKYFEKKEKRQYELIILLLALGFLNGYGLVLVIFWVAIFVQEIYTKRLRLRNYLPIGLTLLLVLLVQIRFKPPSDSIFANQFDEVTFSSMKSAIASVFVFPFLPIHSGPVPFGLLVLLGLSIITLVTYILSRLNLQYQLALSLMLVLSLFNSLFGYYLYWWHFGSVFLLFLAAFYSSANEKVRWDKINKSVSVLLFLQILGSSFGFGRDFDPPKVYSNLAHVGEFVSQNCNGCVVVTNSSVFGAPLASFIRPTKVYAIDAGQYVDYTIWKRSLLKIATVGEIEEAAASFSNPIVVVSVVDKLNPQEFDLIAEFQGSIWGDDFRVYTPKVKSEIETN
jgi:hypothetical protein